MSKRLLQLEEKKTGLQIEARKLIDSAAKEGRDVLNDEEGKKYDEILSQVRALDSQIKRERELAEIEATEQAKEERATAAVSTSVQVTKQEGEDSKGEKEKFRSLGENLQAIVAAHRPGSRRVDPRLVESRAATGLGEAVGSDGGFLIQKDFATELTTKGYDASVLAPLCRKIQISNPSNGLTLNVLDETSRVDGSRIGGIQGFWADEADAFTASKPKFRQIEMSLHKLTGLLYATEEMLMDAVALESLTNLWFPSEFGFKIDDAIVRGDGAGKPQGFLNSGALVTVSKESGPQTADTVVAANIMKMRSRMYARSRANSVWLYNQDIEPQLHSMYIAGTTVPVYQPMNGLAGAPYDTIYGRPAYAIEQCSTIGDLGDIFYVDLSQYLLIEKGGIQSAVSAHVRFVNDEVVFRFSLRLDGQSLWNSALTPYKGSNTQSPFVTLEAR